MYCAYISKPFAESCSSFQIFLRLTGGHWVVDSWGAFGAPASTFPGVIIYLSVRHNRGEAFVLI